MYTYIGNLAVGTNGLKVAITVRGREGIDESSVDTGDGGSVRVAHAPAVAGACGYVQVLAQSGTITDKDLIRMSDTGKSNGGQQGNDGLLHFWKLVGGLRSKLLNGKKGEGIRLGGTRLRRRMGW